MDLKKKLAAGAFSVLALGGIGAGVANAATSPAPPPATGAPAADAPTPGDTADAPGAADTPEAPGAAGAADTDNVQQGDQNGPDTGGPEAPDAPGAPAK